MNINYNDAQELRLQDVIPSSSSSSSNNLSFSSDSLDDSDNAISIDSSSESEEESEEDENAQMFAAYEELLFNAPRARVENFLDVVHQKSDEEFRQDFRLYRPVAYDLIG